MTETRWVGISRAVFSVFVGCLTVLIAMASDILFWGFAGWPGKLRAKIGESLIEGAAIGILFWLWRTQVHIRQREAEAYARHQRVRNSQIRELLGFIALRAKHEPQIEQHVHAIEQLLDSPTLVEGRTLRWTA